MFFVTGQNVEAVFFSIHQFFDGLRDSAANLPYYKLTLNLHTTFISPCFRYTGKMFLSSFNIQQLDIILAVNSKYSV